LRLPLPDGTEIANRPSVVYGIRPQHISVGGADLKAIAQVVEPTGESQEVTFNAGGIDLVVEIREQPMLKPTQEISLRIMTHKALLFDSVSGARL
jgi:multiple sugar transport system ATP-binding protein